MKAFKFRVWASIGNCFEYFNIYEGANLGIANGVSEPQQHIGIKDKNGKEIYEGDYINFSTNNTICLGDVDIIEWKNQIVHYDETIASFVFGYRQEFTILDKIMLETIEVVGNVFENPELEGKEQ